MLPNITTITRNILLLTSLTLCPLVCAQSSTVEVTEGQPIQKAIKMIENIYNVPISFEDTRYVNESLLVDVTEQVQRTPDPSHRIKGLKTRTLLFTYKLPPPDPSPANGGWPSTGGRWRSSRQEREEGAADALKSVLEGYAAAGGPESFAVVKEGGIFHVTATNFLNPNGKLQQLPAILDTKITIPPGQRTRAALLNEICQVLSKTAAVQVGIWDSPYNEGSNQMQAVTAISGSGVTARSLLSQLLAEMDGQSSTKHETWETAWTIGGGANSSYFLNFHHVILRDN
jgi:hypothetical protein